MRTLDQLFAVLWDRFRELNPQAEEIHQLLTARGEQVVNDHIAFRTFNDPRVNISVLAKPFLAHGYVPSDTYDFPAKRLSAVHFEHPEPVRPKIFISELRLEEMSNTLCSVVADLLDQIDDELLTSEELCISGRPWSLSFKTYEQLAAESEYAGWLAALGFCANHFTILVNELKTLSSLQELNELLKQSGVELNTSGGEIKGSPDELLEQSSTLAAVRPIDFEDGQFPIPCCYYEFARRYPQADGTLFQGFIARSADKIFQSTDRRQA